MRKLTLGSLFAGIGGFDLGFERAGFETVWQVEIDEYCRRVLERHFPRAERFGDIRGCGAHNLKPVDVICGGFPCQDVSKAGFRAGIEDGTRSGLWFEMCRVVCQLRPRFVVVENVTGLLERGIGRVLGDLASNGFDAEWDCLPAFTFGAPQPRDRAFIVAYANGERPLHGQTGRFAAETRMQAFGHVRTGCDARVLRGEAKNHGQIGEYERFCEPAIHRVCNGLPSELDKSRIEHLGNAVVPQIAQWIAERMRDSCI